MAQFVTRNATWVILDFIFPVSSLLCHGPLVSEHGAEGSGMKALSKEGLTVSKGRLHVNELLL